MLIDFLTLHKPACYLYSPFLKRRFCTLLHASPVHLLLFYFKWAVCIVRITINKGRFVDLQLIAVHKFCYIFRKTRIVCARQQAICLFFENVVWCLRFALNLALEKFMYMPTKIGRQFC